MTNIRERIMGRRATTSPNGKRGFEVKFYCDQKMYDDIVSFAHVAGKPKSEFTCDLLHVALYGLYGGGKSSRTVDGKSRATTRPESECEE